jgi:trehalose/maltose hydrolase-like predicted phosphorylase
MYPTVLLLHPDLAASLLQYRIERLEEAGTKAKNLGFQGALFPWESAFTGAEVEISLKIRDMELDLSCWGT